MNLKLKKFDPGKIKDNVVVVFIGKRGTGKTTLVTDILYHKRHIPVGVVMSGTEEGNGHYSSYVPDSFIYPDYNRDVIERVIERQKRLVSDKTNKTMDKHAFILLDDCMYDKKITRDKCIRQICMNGRHWAVFFAVTMQYCLDLTPDIRNNIDYVFVCRENVRTNREKIYKSFFGIFPTFAMFSQVMDACTENYECLVLDNTSISNKIEDCVFWYKAERHVPFRVGGPEFWNYHQQAYDPKYMNRREDSSLTDTNKGKRGGRGKKDDGVSITKVC